MFGQFFTIALERHVNNVIGKRPTQQFQINLSISIQFYLYKVLNHNDRRTKLPLHPKQMDSTLTLLTTDG